jgi:hypothetical protein
VPPPNAPAQVDLGAIPAGSRVTVWISPPAARSARAASRQPCVAFDIVDPATGEALMHGGGSAAKRVTIQPAGSSAAGRILIKGGMIRVVPVGLAHGARGPADGETIGPIAAMATDR